ncbi:hypothetical protein ACFY4Q_31830 [[Kitasatospora] papulosa]|uniref:nSTAND1 domain-containing NTPase n=1 Tax=[Kitasatospora] papulosa TaxID=1464011 RepID=UPI0036ABA3A2
MSSRSRGRPSLSFLTGGRAGHLFVVDQMEEYAGVAPDAARRLFHLQIHLCGTVDGESGSVPRAVVTARHDSIDALMTAATSSALSDAVMFLAPLGPDDLRDAITRPVDAVPGLWVEHGLADRIVRDAADEPGRMPLVEFALTRLWDQPERSMLTHGAYQDFGGIAGALAGYAEDSFRAVVREDEIPLAQALFVQLARPADQGGYTRRPAPVTDMNPAALALARRLSPGKLIVFGRTDGGTEIVDLAHEALTRHWPRLGGWLDDSRKFRSWQEELRRDLARWKEAGEETGALLRGSVLEVAVEQAGHRPTEITALERAYIGASRRFARRALRRWQALVATLLALLVGTGVLANMALDSSQTAERQLRTLASRALADESSDRANHDPGSSIQLALAAWHADDTPQAQEALLHSHVTGEYLRASHVGLWPGRATRLDATADGRTLVVWSKPAGAAPVVLSVVTGTMDGSPRSYALRGAPTGDVRSEISSDGNLLGRRAKSVGAERGRHRPPVVGEPAENHRTPHGRGPPGQRDRSGLGRHSDHGVRRRLRPLGDSNGPSYRRLPHRARHQSDSGRPRRPPDRLRQGLAANLRPTSRELVPHLCSSAGRDYTEEERRRFLPAGTSSGLPCENASPWRGVPTAD